MMFCWFDGASNLMKWKRRDEKLKNTFFSTEIASKNTYAVYVQTKLNFGSGWLDLEQHLLNYIKLFFINLLKRKKRFLRKKIPLVQSKLYLCNFYLKFLSLKNLTTLFTV